MTTTDQRTVRDVEQRPAADEFIHYDHIGHGSTPAAWTLSLVIVLGSLVAGIGVIIPSLTVALIGAALMPVGIILGIVMKKMGLGVEMDSKAVLRRLHRLTRRCPQFSIPSSKGSVRTSRLGWRRPPCARSLRGRLRPPRP